MGRKKRSVVRAPLVERRDSQRGVAMISLLAVVVILGIVATIVISTSASPPPVATAGSNGGTTTTTGVTSIGSDATQAAVSSCIADFTAITTAVSTYETLQGVAPPTGTAWATSGATGAILGTWPSDPPYFRLAWNGRTLDVIPERGVPSRGASGTTSPPTGCYAA